MMSGGAMLPRERASEMRSHASPVSPPAPHPPRSRVPDTAPSPARRVMSADIDLRSRCRCLWQRPMFHLRCRWTRERQTSWRLAIVIFSFVLFLSHDVSVATTAVISPPLDKEQADIMGTLARLVGKNRWNTTSDPCVSPGWSGVRCLPFGVSSVVAELTLRGLGISSSAVFASICRLKTLQVLDLSKNFIPSLPNQSFPCPMSAGLQHLNLSSNRLSAPLANFSVFPKLEILDLSFNNFSGRLSTELNSLPKLTSLNLSSNNLEGDVPHPTSISLVLEELVLSRNQFTGHIPKDLFQCSNLTMLDLSQNNMTGEATNDFGKLHNLQTLLLSGNNLSGQIPENLTTLKNLSRFVANQNNLIGPIPGGITNHVRMLDLSYNDLSGTIPSDLLSPSGLETVDLTGNQLEGNITQNISSSLFRLRLGSNRLSGGIPDSIGDALDLAYLELDSNKLAGNIPSRLGNCKNLTLLNLANNWLEGSVPSDFVINNGNPGVSNVTQDNKDSPSRSRRHTTLIIIFALAGTLIGMIVLATVAVYTYSKRVYRVEDGVLVENVPHLNSAIEFMKRKQGDWQITPFQALEFEDVTILWGLKEENLIGRGGSGHVYRVTYSRQYNGSTGVVAVKEIRSAGWLDEKLERQYAGYPGEIEAVFRLGVQCTGSSPSSRPTMKDVLQILLKCSKRTDQKTREERAVEREAAPLFLPQRGSRRRWFSSSKGIFIEEKIDVHCIA
ncbi:hypothetical protein EJB05_02662, partial [Eragrostis curvula]